MKLSPERQQMVDTLLSELNTLKPEYVQKGFIFEASQAYDFDHSINIVIKHDNYTLKSDIRLSIDLFGEQTKKLINILLDLLSTLNVFEDFLTLFHDSGFETRGTHELTIDHKYENIQITLDVPTKRQAIEVKLGFHSRYEYINQVELFSKLGEDYTDYRITIPGTTAQLTVDGSSNAYNEMYVQDNKYFFYNSPTTQIIDYIAKFINIIEELDLEIR